MQENSERDKTYGTQCYTMEKHDVLCPTIFITAQVELTGHFTGWYLSSHYNMVAHYFKPKSCQLAHLLCVHISITKLNAHYSGIHIKHWNIVMVHFTISRGRYVWSVEFMFFSTHLHFLWEAPSFNMQMMCSLTGKIREQMTIWIEESLCHLGAMPVPSKKGGW